MTKLQKILLAAFVSASFGISAVSAYADASDSKEANASRSKCGPMQFDQAKFAKKMAQRQAQLHDKLNLTSDQEAAWNTFTSSMKPPATRAKPDWAAISAMSAPDRMDKMISMMKERETKMADRAAAVKTFYGVLTPAQQKIFDAQFAMHGRDGKHGHRAK